MHITPFSKGPPQWGWTLWGVQILHCAFGSFDGVREGTAEGRRGLVHKRRLKNLTKMRARLTDEIGRQRLGRLFSALKIAKFRSNSDRPSPRGADGERLLPGCTDSRTDLRPVESGSSFAQTERNSASARLTSSPKAEHLETAAHEVKLIVNHFDESAKSPFWPCAERGADTHKEKGLCCLAE